MASIGLYEHQLKALNKMQKGCILCGGVGSGKSRTALAYYYICQGGELDHEEYFPMDDPPQDLYIITTARKRDTLEWDGEMAPFLLSIHPEVSLYSNKVIVDSWNNIKKYADVTNAFFIFDEQRVVGYGTWVKSFLKIAKNNHWILLSATPGDTWQDYIPVFIANGFFKNKTEFTRNHVVYSRFSKFPKIDRYINSGRLVRLRNSILIDMDFKRETMRHDIYLNTEFDKSIYSKIMKDRWDIWKNEPIENAGTLCYLLRRVINSDPSRIQEVKNVLKDHPKAIIFYNFDYELELLKELLSEISVSYAEWNGHKHQEIPNEKSWVYLVQYNAGCEGWNCIKTDTVIFYSQNYSYKVLEQAKGRIDRLNTPYVDLYYYHLTSKSTIDRSIFKALQNKKNFNTGRFAKI